MRITGMKSREILDLAVVTFLAILFSVFGITIHFIENIYKFFQDYYGSEIARFSVNFIFLYLSGLLWVTYRRWRSAERKRRELEGVITSIDPDALVVIDAKQTILMCNKAVEKMFGYTVEELTGQSVGILYSDSQSFSDQWREMHHILGKEGFHIQSASGKKKDGEVISLEIVTGNLQSFDGVVSLIRDVTEKKKAEESIQQAYGELDQIFNTAADGMWVVGKDSKVMKINQTMARLFSLDEKAVEGRFCYDVLQCPEQSRATCSLKQLARGEVLKETEISLPKGDGGPAITCLLTVAPFSDSTGKVVGIIEDFRDITAIKELEQKLRDMSLTDELTGLYNRRGFFALAEQQYRLSIRNKRSMILFFIDLDGMKWINDSFGHDEGDEALIAAAGILKDAMRSSDIVARVGGDEFVVLAIEAEESSIATIDERIKERLHARAQSAESPYPLSLSVGWAFFDPHNPCSMDDLMKSADHAMYEQKRLHSPFPHR